MTTTVTEREGAGHWSVRGRQDSECRISNFYHIAGRIDQPPVAYVIDHDDAEKVVRAFNAHDDLVACVRWAVENDGECLGDWPKLLDRARTALAKASAS